MAEHHVRVVVVGAKRWVYIDDIEVMYTGSMGTRQNLENVDVYFGDPWYDPAPVYVRNVILMEVLFQEFTLTANGSWVPVYHNTELANDLILEADFEFEVEIKINTF